MAKQKNTLAEIPILIENQLWNTAANRLYYASFFAVSALLLEKDIHSKTHAGLKQMFSLHYIKPGVISKSSGDFYNFVFDLRQTGDYDDFNELSSDDVQKLLQPASFFIAEIEAYLFQK